MRLDTATGCTSALPGLGRTIRSPLLDDRHVYWRDGGATLTTSAVGEGQLVRLNLESSRLERLVGPGLEPAASYELLAQDDEQLYVRSTGPLLAVRKPL